MILLETYRVGSLVVRLQCLFVAEWQISGKFLRVETNLYLHTQREAKFKNFNFKNFAFTNKHVVPLVDHVHFDYVFSYAFSISRCGREGSPFVICGKSPLLPSPFYSQPVVFFQNFSA